MKCRRMEASAEVMKKSTRRKQQWDQKVLSVQRDYMAGEWSRDYTNKYLLSEDVVNAIQKWTDSCA